KGKYDQTIDRESAFEKLQKGMAGDAAPVPQGEAGQQPAPQSGGLLDQIGAIVATIFGTNRKRGQRLSTGQSMARDITRTVTNQVAGKLAANIGKQLAGSAGGAAGRAIVRGA